ncbi:unnamed protein product [Arctia plantaginis]|uniref:Uncharacterized protein n=1 Tax=Arctia plantaginis TaxID=874455 RepID=A0A8S1ALK2_ARCPL|nr:unnamed protein product [Arctia plantaginis]
MASFFFENNYSLSHFYLHSLFSTGVNELERQNKITKQILEAFIQKKLGLRNNSYRAPSVFEILPMPALVTAKKPEPVHDPEEEVQDQDNLDSKESQEYNDSESLQSVESEQINSIYNTEGMYPFLL